MSTLATSSSRARTRARDAAWWSPASGAGFGRSAPSASPAFFEAAPHVAPGDLSDATAALLREMERTLRALASREDDASDANARRATTDAAAATQEVVNAILVFSRARRKGAVRNGRGKDDAAPSTSSPESSSTFRLAVPAVGCARRCLEATRRAGVPRRGRPRGRPSLCRGGGSASRGGDSPSAPDSSRRNIARARTVAPRALLRARSSGERDGGERREGLAHADDPGGEGGLAG